MSTEGKRVMREERRTIRMGYMEGGEVFEEEDQVLRKIDQDRRHGAAR